MAKENTPETNGATGQALVTESRFADPDAAFRLIVEAHRGLSDAESAAFNARLVLILANHCGRMDVLRAALDLARKSGVV